MSADRVLFFDSRFEIFPLQHLLQRHATVQANYVFERHGAKPVPVADCLGARRIKNFERLLPVRGGVRHYFLVCQLRTRRRASAGIADHSGEIAND